MTGRIYLLHENSELMAMDEAPYDSEKLLQETLAKHPNLLAGEQIDSDEPRRWLLVTREMSVQDKQDGAARWSLDHLFLDQDAVPTLVEVKRSSDRRLRRETVGQMLDYAANAVVYWPVEEIRAKFKSRCEKCREDPEEVLAAFLEVDHEPDEFWQQVKTNLQAGRIRMIFLADVIPAELRRVIEFLNEQMDPAEVLAIEVKQYIGTGMKTLVPRAIGQTETARQKKSPSTKAAIEWNQEAFMKALRECCGEAPQAVAKHLLDWITPQVSYVWWGRGSKDGGIVPMIRKGKPKYHICHMTTQGWLAFRFDWLYKKPPFNNESTRRELLRKINDIPSVQFNESVLTKRAQVPFAVLADPAAMEVLKKSLAWLIEQVHAECEREEAATARR